MRRIVLWTVRVLLIAALCGWTAMLHGFSAQSADTSSDLSGGICYRIAALFVPDFDTLPPAEQADIAAQFQHPVRKAAHFCEYGLGGVLAACLLTTFAQNRRWWQFAYATAFGMLTAVGDEWHQTFVAGRSAQMSDVLLDTVGFACGLAAVWCIAWLCRRAKKPVAI